LIELAGILLLTALIQSCGGDSPSSQPDSDRTPPSRVGDLVATALTDTTIRLTWTAPGDDAGEGRAASYDLRYSTEPFPAAGHFPPGYPPVSNTPSPAASQVAETLLVSQLAPTTKYYFAMRVADEADNVSPVSNIATTTTFASPPPPDIIPPAMISDLRYGPRSTRLLTFFWTTPGDDAYQGQVARYEFRRALMPIDQDNWLDSETVGGAISPGLPMTNASFEIVLDQLDVTYFYALRAFDEADNSTISNTVSVEAVTSGILAVNSDGTGEYPTIQAALNAARIGDQILLGPGEYQENLIFPSTNLQITSKAGPEYTTIRPAQPTHRTILCEGKSWTEWTVEGVTLMGDGETRGGGVFCTGGRLTVRDCAFLRNRAEDAGAIAITSSLPAGSQAHMIERCTFIENSASRNGGAIGVVNEPSAIVVSDCDFIGNIAGLDGGAIWSLAPGRSEINNCRFARNQGLDHGGALYFAAPLAGHHVLIERNTFLENYAAGIGTGDTGAGGGIFLFEITGTIRNNTFYGNSGLTESVFGGGDLLLSHVGAELVIERNIFAKSQKSSICLELPRSGALIRNCIAWEVDGPVISIVRGDGIPIDWNTQLEIVDPLFCEPISSELQLRDDSPAFQNVEVIGAQAQPGCQ
jgi:hypothetical protein